MTITINDQNAGIASLATEDFTTNEKFTGDSAPTTDNHILATAVVATELLPALTPLYLDPATNQLVVAVQADATDPKPATCLNVYEIPEGLVTPIISVYRTGMFNPDVINWPASYDTDIKKATAFEANGRGIFIKKGPHDHA